MREYDDLRVSQLRACEAIMANPEFMLAADMGIGKTGAVLTAIRRLIDSFCVVRALVVAPLLVAEETWPQEIEIWEHTADMTYEVLTGPAERREQRARRLPELTIVNKENLVWLIEFWEKNGGWPYDMVVIDEMSGFKNPTKRNKPTKVAVQKVIDGVLASAPKDWDDEDIEAAVRKATKQTKGQLTRFGALCKVRKSIDWMVGMTGTPAPNGLLDIWSQYFLLDQGERLFSNITQYKTRWFESDYMGYKYTLRPGAFESIVDRIKDITLSMKTADFWVDMPEVVYNTIPVRLPPKIMKQYKQFEKDLILAEHDIEAVNEGVLTNKLLQLANGSVYDEDGNVIEIHDLKLEAMDRVIEEAAGQPVLIAYAFQFDLEKLRKRYPKAEVANETKNLTKRWNAGEIPILLAHPQSAGHGLNLQYGGCITVWYGLCWSLEGYQQLNKRLHRPGQRRTVFIHHIVAVDTVDERVMLVLPEKDATQDALIEATKWSPPKK